MPPLFSFYNLCHTFHLEIMELMRNYYHPDHIGSSSWITDGTGQAIQHLHYLPFGEDWVDQRNTSWNAPYTFSGKEKDTETGYGYFGARYYDSGLSIWLSVDPMSDKYPSMSPYNYCANNPVILVDPDGREVFIIGDRAMAAFASLQHGTNLKLSIDFSTGKISASGKPLNDNDDMLFDAINNTDIKVEVLASSHELGNPGGGENHGATWDEGEDFVTTDMRVNISQITNLEKEYNAPAGSGMMHEVTEGYQLGLIAFNNNINIGRVRSAVKTESTSIAFSNRTVILSSTSYIPIDSPDRANQDSAHDSATKQPNQMSIQEKKTFRNIDFKRLNGLKY